jgi:serine/threonine-protein kinase
MMDAEPERWRLVENLFHEALDVVEGERRAHIESRAGGDASVTVEVLALVDAHTKTHALLDSPAVTNLPAGMRLGPYALERVLGSGGMATVYLAHRADRQFEKQVAVKLVNRGLTAELTGDRFQTERQILARLEHPHIARLLDAGVSEFGQPYVVMEWVDGVTLDTWIARERPPLERRLDLWLDIAGAVGYAHRNLVIHRDLKPSNVLVGSDGVAKLVDFGIAKLASDDEGQSKATRTAHFTPLYASPEQLRGLAVTTATDVYGLGLLLYELVTDAHPFRRTGQSAHEQAQAALAHDPAIPPGTPADLGAILQMALRKEPERRYATATEFAEDVRRYRHGLPVVAQPETLAYRSRKFIARHRLAVSAAAVAMLSLVSLTTVALWQAHVANQQRARAEETTEFITGFLGATPTGSDWALRDRGAGLRVVELADLIAERLDRTTPQPETEAAIRYVLGLVYFQTGQAIKGERHLSRARELFAVHASPEDPRRLGADVLAASYHITMGRFAEAERQALDVRARWANPPPSAVSGMSENLGLAQYRLGKTDDAERTLRSAIESVERVLGANDRNVGLLSADLALVYLERGQFQQAAERLERAAAISRASASGTSVALGWSLVNLAIAYRFLGQTDEVFRIATEAYDRMREALGEGHYSLVHSLTLLGYVKAIRGEPDAEATARKAVAVQAQLPADHYERAVGLTFLGFVLMHEHKLAEAQRVLEEALRLRRNQFSSPNWRIAETAGWLGEVCAQRGDRARATALLQESLDAFTTLYGSDNPRTREAQARWDRTVEIWR